MGSFYSFIMSLADLGFLHLTILLDEVEKNIMTCQWKAGQLFAKAKGWGK